MSSTERDSIVHQFQTGKIHFIVTPAKVGGTGITLTRAMRIIMVEALSDSALNDQCTARAHRYGNFNHEGMTVHEIYNSRSSAEMQAKRTREGRIKLASAAANSMLRSIQAREKVMDEDDVVVLTNGTRGELRGKA
jgi:Helicase conserved C-terminal domain